MDKWLTSHDELCSYHILWRRWLAVKRRRAAECGLTPALLKLHSSKSAMQKSENCRELQLI